MARTSRKRDHIENALVSGVSGGTGLDDVRFVHNCLPDIAMDQIDIRTTIGGLALSSPIVVNAMTGGAAETYSINRMLGIVARERALAVAVGSQMAAIRDESMAATYRVVREENPKGMVWGNLGSEATPEMAKRAVDMIEANALQIHLNVMQELIMPEGDRDFTGAARRIEAIVQALDVPVIVKEVGFGMSRESIRRLVDCGVAVIDIGGRGGTNFARIENMRRGVPLDLLNDWGISTAASLLEASAFVGQVSIMASGGLQTGLDAVRSLALGASCTGYAGAFLSYAVENDIEGALSYVDGLHEQIRICMTALGARTIPELGRVPLVITGASRDWAELRGMDCASFARRTSVYSDRTHQ